MQHRSVLGYTQKKNEVDESSMSLAKKSFRSSASSACQRITRSNSSENILVDLSASIASTVRTSSNAFPPPHSHGVEGGAWFWRVVLACGVVCGVVCIAVRGGVVEMGCCVRSTPSQQLQIRNENVRIKWQ